MRYELAKLKVQLNTTMVYVTHDQAEAMTLADKIVVVKDGVIEQEGSPLELYASPVNIFVAKFIGSSEMNIFEASFLQNKGKLSVFRLNSGEEISFISKEGVEYSSDNKYFVGVRPEDIDIIQPNGMFFGNKFSAVVSLSENLGGEGYVHATLSDGNSISVKSKKDTIGQHRGSNVTLGYDFEKGYLFDENGLLMIGQTS
jgi:ABC-type sugar transport system ATPase subunit